MSKVQVQVTCPICTAMFDTEVDNDFNQTRERCAKVLDEMAAKYFAEAGRVMHARIPSVEAEVALDLCSQLASAFYGAAAKLRVLPEVEV